MWYTWIHGAAKPEGDKPQTWWRQLECERRSGLPFAHLFPRPPAHAAPRATEAETLIREITHRPPREPSLEEIVQQHRVRPPTRTWEPVEAWQIVSIGRLDAQESHKWGEDGNQVVEWFDRAELVDLAASAASSSKDADPAQCTPSGWRGLVFRIRCWLQPKRGFELAGAEH